MLITLPPTFCPARKLDIHYFSLVLFAAQWQALTVQQKFAGRLEEFWNELLKIRQYSAQRDTSQIKEVPTLLNQG